MNPDDLTPDERQLLVRLADCELEPRQVEEAFSASPAGERAQRRAPARESLHRLVDLGVLACMVVHYDRAGPTA